MYYLCLVLLFSLLRTVAGKAKNTEQFIKWKYESVILWDIATLLNPLRDRRKGGEKQIGKAKDAIIKTER